MRKPATLDPELLQSFAGTYLTPANVKFQVSYQPGAGASAAGKASQDNSVKQVIICTPDKDLSQCVVGTRVVQPDRRRDILRDEAGG